MNEPNRRGSAPSRSIVLRDEQPEDQELVRPASSFVDQVTNHFSRDNDEIQQPNIELMNKRKCMCLLVISTMSLIFALVALIGHDGPEYDYFS